MRDSVMWFLVTTVVLSAMSIVFVRHQHRISYSVYQILETRADELNDEWGQLLIEENLWSFPHRVEKDATQRLSMHSPEAKDVQFVGLPDSLLGANYGSR